MPIPQRALSLGLALMRRFNSAWSRITTLRKVMVIGIAVLTVVAALKNAFDVLTMLVLPCAILTVVDMGVISTFWSPGLKE